MPYYPPPSAPGGAVTLTSVAIPFTDGDSMRRVTITDAAVTATSKIIGSIRSADTADDSADKGFRYTANVVNQAAGSFDLSVVCTAWGADDATLAGINETVFFVYTVGS